MEDSRAVSGWAGAQEILTGKILTVDELVTIIDSITAEDIRKIARELFIRERLRMAVVGPLSSDAPLGDLLTV